MGSFARTQCRIVVVGGGVAGAEAALTLSRGLPDAQVTLLTEWSSIRVLPDLVYVPFGIAPWQFDVPVAQLAEHGVDVRVTHVQRVDVRRKLVHTDDGMVRFDALVVAPGAQTREGSEHGLRTLADAIALRESLAAILDEARRGSLRSIAIRAATEDAWTAPACELSLLIGAWVRAHKLDKRVETYLVTPDRDVFPWFGPLAETVVEAALRRARVQVSTDVPVGRLDQVASDLVVNFGSLEARRIEGVPGYGTSGWYSPGPSFEVARHVFVIGDAVDLPYRAGFATAWQARRVLQELGGDVARLGSEIGGIDVGSVEYQMDLADAVLTAHVPCGDSLGRPFLGHDADIEVTAGARPDKLQGLLLHELIIRPRQTTYDAPLAFRDALRRRAVA